MHQVPQRLSVDELHHDRKMIVSGKRFVNGDYIRMIEGGCCAGFFDQSLAMAGTGSGQYLQGHDPPQVPIVRGVNSPKAALPDQTQDQVAAQLMAHRIFRTKGGRGWQGPAGSTRGGDFEKSENLTANSGVEVT